jgi:endo-alpha-1,4-polygalactosaminidase (GH114 family)
MEKLETKAKSAIKDDNAIQKLKEEKENLENELEASERNWKALKKADKSKDKENYDFKKENSKLMDKCASNKEKKDFEKENRETWKEGGWCTILFYVWISVC